MFRSCALKTVMVFLGVVHEVIHVTDNNNFYKVALFVKRLVAVMPKWQNDSVAIVKYFWWHCFCPIRSALRRSILHFIYYLLPRFSNKIQVNTAFKKLSYRCLFPTRAWAKRIFSAGADTPNTIGLFFRSYVKPS